MNLEVYIDEESYISLRGDTVLQASLSNGIEIPRFCYHEKLSIAGNCRMCLVEISYPKSFKPMASCALPLVENMVIFTNTMLVKKAREGVLEFLLANHPLDCPICDQGGECDLQDESLYFGGDRGRFYEEKRSVEDKECGPLIKTVMNRCIHCTRCVRYAVEVAGVPFLGTLGRGSKMEIGTYVKQLLDSEVSGNLIDLCPVGALTSKPYAFVARPWELRSHETVDIMDSICSRVKVDLRGSEIVRILPSSNEGLNEDWITDKTRFFYDSLKRQRLYSPLVKIDNILVPVSWETSFFVASQFLNFYLKPNGLPSSNNIFGYSDVFLGNKSAFFGVFGDLVDLETLLVLKDFFVQLGSGYLFYQAENSFSDSIDFRSSYLLNISLSEVERIDFCALFGLNPRLECPLLNLRIRKSFLANSSIIFSFGFLSGLTYSCFQQGNNFFDVVNFFSGKLYSSKKLAEAKLPMLLVGPFFSRSNLSNFFSDNLRFLVKFSNIILSRNFNVDWFGLNFLSFSAVSYLGAKELGLGYRGFSNVPVFCNSFLYLCGVEELFTDNLLGNSNFVVYQGHTGDSVALLADVVFPGCAFVEKESSYLNLGGKLQRTKNIITPPFFSQTDWKIVSAFKLFFYRRFILRNDSEPIASVFDKHSFLKSMKEVRSRMLLLSPVFRTGALFDSFSLKVCKNRIRLKSFFSGYLGVFLFNNKLIVSNRENFFFTNILTRVSRTLSLSASRFKNRQVNFVA